MAEGESHDRVIILAALISPDDVVLVAGFVVAVPHIDPLNIHAVVLLRAVQVHLCRIGIGLGEDTVGIQHPGCHGRRREIVAGVGIGQAAGGIHTARQNVRYTHRTGHADVADPQARIHIDVCAVEEVKLHGNRRVEQHDDTLEHARLLQFGQALKQVFLFLGDGQVAAIQSVAALGGHVEALTAITGKHDNGGVTEVSEGLALRRSHVFPRELVGTISLDQTVHSIQAQTGSLLRVPVPQGSVNREALLFKGCAQRSVAIRFGSTGAGRAITRVHRTLCKEADLRLLRQGQRAVLIGQQHQTFRLHLTA